MKRCWSNNITFEVISLKFFAIFQATFEFRFGRTLGFDLKNLSTLSWFPWQIEGVNQIGNAVVAGAGNN